MQRTDFDWIWNLGFAAQFVQKWYVREVTIFILRTNWNQFIQKFVTVLFGDFISYKVKKKIMYVRIENTEKNGDLKPRLAKGKLIL